MNRMNSVDKERRNDLGWHWNRSSICVLTVLPLWFLFCILELLIVVLISLKVLWLYFALEKTVAAVKLRAMTRDKCMSQELVVTWSFMLVGCCGTVLFVSIGELCVC